MKTKIIAAFPGMGKSAFSNHHPELCSDSDSSNFSWVKDEDGKNTKKRNPEFPQNYIDHIKDLIGNYEYVFVSSHKEVREALEENCIFYYLVIPGIARKEEFIERYKNRNSPEGFIKFIEDNWTIWLDECRELSVGRKIVVCDKKNLEYMANIIEFLEK